MKKPRFLQVITTWFDEGPSFLSNELRYIHWYGYPTSRFPESFQPRMLVVLKLERSLQKEIWKGCKYLPSLKELELVNASKLVRTPNFGGLPSLRKLRLEDCGSLEEIHRSLGNHKSLVQIRVRGCDKLTRFPSIVGLKRLEILSISQCNALGEFPKIETKMDSLVDLYLYKVGIEVLPSSVGKYCTNLISIKLWWCSKLKSIEGNFHALKCLENFEIRGCKEFNFQQLMLPRCLRRLELTWCHLGDGEIPKVVGELSNLQELDLSFNHFIRLDFGLSRLTSLKHLEVTHCKNLVELPELPSSLAILKAYSCRSLVAIVRDDIPINCKCLCDVSIYGGKSNLIGVERLLETMLQGNFVESGCILVQLQWFEILRVFEPRLVRGERCRMQLPENWYNDFSGFLFCVASENLGLGPAKISMKHEKLEGGLTGLESYDDYCYDESKRTWVGYISFGSLRNTLWWKDQTSTAIHIEFDYRKSSYTEFHGCGCKLIPKRSETTSITDTSSSSDDVYTCPLKILEDSKSKLICYINEYVNKKYYDGD